MRLLGLKKKVKKNTITKQNNWSSRNSKIFER